MNAPHATSSRGDAIKACRLMDTLISTPQWHQSVLTDSIQLFSDSLLTQAKHAQAARDPEQRPLAQILSELQGLLDNAQQELGLFSTKDLELANSSPSLRLDVASLAALNKATKQLLQTIETFQHDFEKDISSRLQHYQQQQHHPTELQDTIPGLGPEARKLNETQRSLREMLDNIRAIRGAVATVTEPPSQTQQSLLLAKRGLVRGSDDSDVQSMLERLAAMAATLERTLQRINA
ncbi:unnamed protein product [Mortierella alpina]